MRATTRKIPDECTRQLDGICGLSFQKAAERMSLDPCAVTYRAGELSTLINKAATARGLAPFALTGQNKYLPNQGQAYVLLGAVEDRGEVKRDTLVVVLHAANEVMRRRRMDFLKEIRPKILELTAPWLALGA